MLTKSDFVKHEECPLWLWLYKFRKDLLPRDSAQLQRIFASGNEIDQLARQLYPEGIEIEDRFEKGFIETKRRMNQGATILFQPTAMTQDGLGATADILTLNQETKLWDLREVKSSTGVKEEHLVDVAFQWICFERAGIKIGKTFLIYINNEYVRDGDVDPEILFTSEDITEEVQQHLDDARKQIEEAKKIISDRTSPDVLLLQKCHDPEKCDYLDFYLHGFPEIYSLVHTLEVDFLKKLLDKGVLDDSLLPQELLEKVGFVPPVPYEKIDTKEIKKELDKLVYPLYFFDYETYSAAIPPFDGTRPYQQLPFQYSLHIQQEKNGPLEHREFLADKFENPMKETIAHLKKDFGEKGSVIVWNENFEMSRNKEMSETFPKESEFLLSLNSRMFDLMKLFKFNRNIYLHSDFQKSHSLKKVLPVICPHLSYEDLEIREGGTASASWPLLAKGEISVEEIDKLRENMLAYCERDTLAMVEILKHLYLKTD